jgi:hypothetical protein
MAEAFETTRTRRIAVPGPSLDLDQLIGEVVETFVQERRCLNEKEGLYLGFGLSYGLFEEDVARSVNGETRYPEKRTYAHFLFTQDHARSNSIRVFFAEGGGEPFGPDDLKKLKWEQSAHHDSVWRTDGLQPLHSVDSSIRAGLVKGTPYGPQDVSLFTHLPRSDSDFLGHVVAVNVERKPGERVAQVSVTGNTWRSPLDPKTHPVVEPGLKHKFG